MNGAMGMSMAASPRPQAESFARLPMLWLSLAFIAGILLASRLPFPALVWLQIAVPGLVLMVVVRLLRPGPLQPLRALASRYWLLPAALIVLCFGAARYQATLPAISPSHIAFFNDHPSELLLTGTLDAPPDVRDTYTNLRLRAEAVDVGTGDEPVGGILLARVPPNRVYTYGQQVRLRGELRTPPENEDFSYRDYLARQGIHSYMPGAQVTVLPGWRGNPILAGIYALKASMLANVHRLFPDPEASLLAGILLGVDTGLTPDLQSAFNRTGTSHIIAISGFNITILTIFLVPLLVRLLGPWRGSAALLLFVLLYAVLVGSGASVVRAAFMGGLVLLARQIGRRSIALLTLAMAGAAMAFFNPLVLWDVGFQLSALATLGIVLYTEPFSQFAMGLMARFASAEAAARLIRPISDFILATLAAQLATLPLIAYYFQRLSPVSLIVNPIILPVQPAVMIVGGLALLLSLPLRALGQLVALFAWPFVLFTVRMVEFFDRLPSTSIHLGASSPLWVLTFYVLLLTCTFGWSRFRQMLASLLARTRTIWPLPVLALLFICVILGWRLAVTSGDGQLHLTFLDVGSADAILIQTPKGRSVLIGGGPSTSMLSDALGRRLPFIRRKLDWLVVAATGEQQVAALPRILDRYPPDQVLWSGNLQASFSARQTDAWLADQGVPITRAGVGQKLDLGEGVLLEVHSVGPRGSVLVLDWQNFRAFLPIGVDTAAMSSLQFGDDLGPADVLLLADSGFALSNPPAWIENLHPTLVVLSVAAGDIDGRPDQETLDSLSGFSLLRTDRNGWISVATNGEEMQVRAERVGVPTPQPE